MRRRTVIRIVKSPSGRQRRRLEEKKGFHRQIGPGGKVEVEIDHLGSVEKRKKRQFSASGFNRLLAHDDWR